MFRLTQYMHQLVEPTPVRRRGTPGSVKPVVIWNLTRRCNLTCKHCYALSADMHYPGELSTEEAKATMADLKAAGVAMFGWGEFLTVLVNFLILAFIIVHILDLTIGAGVASSSFSGPQNPGPDVQMSAYENLVASLSRPGMAIFYTIVMLVVCLHLCQGGWNAINDLGGTGPRLRKVWLIVAILIALAIAVCNGALPMLILAGVIS